MFRLDRTAAVFGCLAATFPVGAQIHLDFEDGTRGSFRSADQISTGTAFKPFMDVADDTAGLGSGNALFLESAGTGSEAYVVFDAPVTLGPNIGDSITLSFDVRTNTTTATQPDSSSGALRFALYADTDGSIGQTFTDPLSGDKVFGTDDGNFDDNGGPIAPDFGLMGFVPVLDETAGTDNAVGNDLRARLRTEGEFTSGVLSGSGTTLTNPTQITTGQEHWPVLGLGTANSLTVEFARDMGELDPINNPGVVEEVLRGTMTVTQGGETWSMTGIDPIADLVRDTFDYLVIADFGDDFDYVLDNFSVTASTATGNTGDYDDSGLWEQGDLDQVLSNWGTAFDAVSAGWINQRPTEGIVDQAELDVVLTNWGGSAAPDFAGSSVPEPASLALLATAGLMLRRPRANA